VKLSGAVEDRLKAKKLKQARFLSNRLELGDRADFIFHSPI
jgi:hypothetical protein